MTSEQRGYGRRMAEFGLRSHKCEICERVFAHKCVKNERRYLCENCGPKEKTVKP